MVSGLETDPRLQSLRKEQRYVTLKAPPSPDLRNPFSTLNELYAGCSDGNEGFKKLKDYWDGMKERRATVWLSPAAARE